MKKTTFKITSIILVVIAFVVIILWLLKIIPGNLIDKIIMLLGITYGIISLVYRKKDNSTIVNKKDIP